MRNAALFFCLILFATACSDKFEKSQFYALGTLVEITHTKHFELKKAIKTLNNYENQVKSFEEAYNNAPAGSSFAVTPLWQFLFKKSYDYKALSKDRFDIRSFSIAYLYGFPEGPYNMPEEEVFAAVADAIRNKPLVFLNGEVVKEDERIKISADAFSKGLIVDKTVEELKKEGAESGIVNAGGTLYAFGKKNKSKWKIGITYPETPTKELATVYLKDKAVATNGDYESFFIKDGERYNHIFDMLTMKPANLYKSVSVIANTCEEADGLATVFFLLPEAEAAETCRRTGTPVLLYTQDQRIVKLCGWENFEN